MKSDKGKPRYIGPLLGEMKSPATWATRLGQPQVSSGRGTQPAAAMFLRSEFIQQWTMWIGEAKTMFLPQHDPTRIYTEEQFNALVRSFCHAPRPSPASLFKAQGYSMAVHAIAYEPDQPLILTENGTRAINTWVRPRVGCKSGDVELWEQLLAHLFPDEGDCWEVKRWAATLIACPRVRMKYGLLLSSTMQGVGKTTLCDILRVLVGKRNSSVPSAKEAVESSFTSWIGHKRLVVVNEIYEGRDKQAYHKLKSYITDETVRVNEKFMPAYEIQNWAHFILCSNAELALRIEADDRRFLVPTVTEQKQSPEFWEKLHEWLQCGGYANIMQWAHDFVERHGAVRPGADAPTTARKRQMIEDSRSTEERLVMDLAAAALAMAEVNGRPVILTEGEVIDWLRERSANGPRKTVDLRANVIRRWLRAAGMSIAGRLTISGRKQHVAGTMPLEGQGWAELSPYRVRPGDLESI